MNIESNLVGEVFFGFLVKHLRIHFLSMHRYIVRCVDVECCKFDSEANI